MANVHGYADERVPLIPLVPKLEYHGDNADVDSVTLKLSVNIGTAANPHYVKKVLTLLLPA